MGWRQRAAALKGALRISDTVNNQDFWGIVWGRPSAFLILVLFGDVKALTPNIVTHISNACFIAGSLLLLPSFGAHWLWAALFLNLSLSFDCADGQLARYRGAGSELGSFYDKVSDALGLILLFSVLGWIVTNETGELRFFLFASLAASSQLTSGYAKWVCMTALARRGHEPEAPEEREIPAWQIVPRILMQALRFSEPDLLLWVTVGIFIDRLDLVLWLSVLTQVPVAAVAVAYRTKQVMDSDRRAREEG